MAESIDQALARLMGTMGAVSAKKGKFRGCLYGDSGVGKTVLAAGILKQLIEPGQSIIYIDTSDGTESLNNHGNLVEGIIALPFTTIEDIRILKDGIKFKQGPLANVGGIILDEGSTMSQMDTDRLFDARKKADPDKMSEVLTPEWADYNASVARFRLMLAELFDLPGVHVIVNAHIGEKKDKSGNVNKIFPGFSPSIAKKVKEPLHLVGHMTAVYKPNLADPEAPPTYARMVQVHPTGMIDAKSRIGGMPIRMTDMVLVSKIRDWSEKGGALVSSEVAIPAHEEPDPMATAEFDKKTPAEKVEAVAESQFVVDVDEIDLDFTPVSN